jgi:phospholipase C
MDTRRSFLKKAALLSGGAGLAGMMPSSIQKAFAIDPVAGSTWLDAEHIVFLMQENRSFDHCLGSLQGVRGFNDPRAISLPNKNPVWLQTNAEGKTYAPFRMDMHNTKITWMGGLPHSWWDQVDARNDGKYDTWLIAKRYGDEDYKDFPMALGYHTREDLPFYYALADAFTVCDQNFCSSLTGTTPNRLYFWSGTIRENANTKARVWNGDTDYDNNAAWTTYPERLEQNGVSWRVYQNELSVGAGLNSEEDAWLANFTDNPLEWIEQYHVKLSPTYIDWLQRAPKVISNEIAKLETELQNASGKNADALKKQIARRKQYLERVFAEQKIYTKEKYGSLSALEKNLHDKAFTTNRNDPDYHKLASFSYKDGETERELAIPKGDVLHQFRKDVADGKLPTVSWLVAPEKFSDHPSAPWFGAWYVSEVMDILTKDPAVWKKTIFVVTYDENDGYFDHVPPFVPPHKPGSGKVSSGIDTAIEYVRMDQQALDEKRMRESPIGLGYRVPMIVASPWSRGGWVNSQVFDHTSSLQLLENFLQHKKGKQIQETNISDWRRCVCGDLTSIFRTYNGEKIELPQSVKKEPFIASLHKTRFKAAPGDWKPLSVAAIDEIRKDPYSSEWMAKQEKGVRSSCALPYELYVNGGLTSDRKQFEISFESARNLFNEKSAGAPFIIYANGKYQDEEMRNWAYAVRAGDRINDQWTITDFENGLYHLKVYGPNGFFREFLGNKTDPLIDVNIGYEYSKAGSKKPTGNLVISVKNLSAGKNYIVEIADKSYRKNSRTLTLSKAKPSAKLVWDLRDSFNWYDISIKVKDHPHFEKRYAGRVETGQHGKTDPLMGGVV